MKHYVVDVCEDREKTLQAIGQLVQHGAWPITVLYRDDTYLDGIEYELLQDFGPTILESGRVQFMDDKEFKTRKGLDVLVDPEMVGTKKLDMILEGIEKRE